MREIILASASERRARILLECGIEHRVVPSGIEENHDSELPVSEIVSMNARAKAEAVSVRFADSIIIGADTLVVHGKDIIGKPGDESAAKELLARFSGTEVEVYTGLCVIDTSSDRKACGFERSDLSVVPLTEEDAEKFFPFMGPYDKAGGFSIEGIGSMLFDDIRGSYFNILGLPMMKLRELFAQVGLDILDYVKG